MESNDYEVINRIKNAELNVQSDQFNYVSNLDSITFDRVNRITI